MCGIELPRLTMTLFLELNEKNISLPYCSLPNGKPDQAWNNFQIVPPPSHSEQFLWFVFRNIMDLENLYCAFPFHLGGLCLIVIIITLMVYSSENYADTSMQIHNIKVLNNNILPYPLFC